MSSRASSSRLALLATVAIVLWLGAFQPTETLAAKNKQGNSDQWYLYEDVFPVIFPHNSLLSVYLGGTCKGEALLEQGLPLPQDMCFPGNALVSLEEVLPDESLIKILLDGKPMAGDITGIRINCPKSRIYLTNAEQADPENPVCPVTGKPFNNICISFLNIISVKLGCVPNICKPAPKLSHEQCKNRIATCAYRAAFMKFVPGCKNKKGKPMGDGGCQCAGYCGYKCKEACEKDSYDCMWNDADKKCVQLYPDAPLDPCDMVYEMVEEEPGRRLLATKDARKLAFGGKPVPKMQPRQFQSLADEFAKLISKVLDPSSS